MRTMSASEFRAKCLATLDEVEKTGEPVTILKRGRPVAQLVRAPRGKARYPQDELVGTGEILGDIVSPAAELSEWDALRDESKLVPKRDESRLVRTIG